MQRTQKQTILIFNTTGTTTEKNCLINKMQILTITYYDQKKQ